MAAERCNSRKILILVIFFCLIMLLSMFVHIHAAGRSLPAVAKKYHHHNDVVLKPAADDEGGYYKLPVNLIVGIKNSGPSPGKGHNSNVGSIH